MSESFGPDTTLVIRNPVSGRPTSRARADTVERRLRERGYRVEHTDAQGSATGLATHAVASRGCTSILVIGGDGTLFEAIAELPEDVALGVFPTGTVNLLARTLEVPREPEAWLSLLERGTPREAYFARANGRPFTSVGSSGLDAKTVAALDPRAKRALQEVAYALTAVRLYFTHSEPRYRVDLDGKPWEGGPLVGVVFSLGPHYGGPHRIFPDADASEPRLHVGLLGGRSRRAQWKYAAALLAGNLTRVPGASVHSVSSLRIEADPPIAAQLDGDAFGETPLEIAVEPTPRRVLAPAP